LQPDILFFILQMPGDLLYLYVLGIINAAFIIQQPLCLVQYFRTNNYAGQSNRGKQDLQAFMF